MIQGNLTAAGVPVMECLDIATSANGNIVIYYFLKMCYYDLYIDPYN
jgi:hypothetical protein